MGEWYAPQAAAELLAFRVARRRLRARRRDARRARARRALGAPDDALRPRLPAHAAARAVLVLQAPARLPPGRARASTSSAATRSTRSRGSRRSRACAAAGARRRAPRRRARARLGGPFDAVDHVAALSGADRLPRAAPLRLRAARARRPARAEIGAAARGTSQAAIAAYSDGVAAVLATRRGRAAAAARRSLVVVNDRRDLYPRSSSAPAFASTRLRRHVNRRTGRRAGEYFEDVLVAVAE